MENIENITIATNKKKFRINGDYERMLELDVTDMSIITRGKELLPQLDALQKDAATRFVSLKATDDDVETLDKLASTIEEIDHNMRECLDKIFDANVSETCAPTGTMYDPINGKFRYEIIIETLMNLFGDNISNEFKKMENRLKKHTGKYTKKKS